MNFQNLEHVRNLIREGAGRDGVLILIARLGGGEARHEISRRRLYNVREKFTQALGVPKEKIVIGEGERVKGFGRVEFYLGGEFIGSLLVSKLSDICVGCCGPDEQFYPYKDEVERKQKRRRRSH